MRIALCRGPQKVLEGMLAPAMQEWKPYILTPHEFICDGEKVVSVGRFSLAGRTALPASDNCPVGRLIRTLGAECGVAFRSVGPAFAFWASAIIPL